MAIDISILVTFHSEGAVAEATILSLRRAILRLTSLGFSCEVLVALDRADERTREIVFANKQSFDETWETDFGEPAHARNFLVAKSTAEYVAIVDGDDLISENWFGDALVCATASPADAVWHPEFVYYFSEDDFLVNSAGESVDARARSHFLKQESSGNLDRMEFLAFNNPWNAQCLASRQIFLNTPYIPNSAVEGFGFEDWNWNNETLRKETCHFVVPNTLHMVRGKRIGSLNENNLQSGKLPHLTFSLVRGSD